MVRLHGDSAGSSGPAHERIVERLNLVSLRQYINLNEIVLTAVDTLAPGQTLAITDTSSPAWVRDLLREHRPDEEFVFRFIKPESSDRYELRVDRPLASSGKDNSGQFPELYLG